LKRSDHKAGHRARVSARKAGGRIRIAGFPGFVVNRLLVKNAEEGVGTS
jgi:hypothetical protein